MRASSPRASAEAGGVTVVAPERSAADLAAVAARRRTSLLRRSTLAVAAVRSVLPPPPPLPPCCLPAALRLPVRFTAASLLQILIASLGSLLHCCSYHTRRLLFSLVSQLIRPSNFRISQKWLPAVLVPALGAWPRESWIIVLHRQPTSTQWLAC